MNLLEAITEANLLATGKATAPTNTSSRYLALKGFSNVVQKMWQDEPDVQWNSLAFTASVVAVVSATDTFLIPVTVREISQLPDDNIHIQHTDGQFTYYTLVEPDELQKYKRAGMQAVSRKGANLVFAISFTALDPQFGGTVKIPAYGYVTVLSADSDVLVVDSPTWATFMMAAEYCRTKTSLQYRSDGLVERASEEMRKMKQNQEGSEPSTIRFNLSQGRAW